MGEDIEQMLLKTTPHYEEKQFTVTTLRRKMRTVFDFVEEYGHIAVITVRGKKDCVIMSLETYLLMTRYATDEKTLKNRALTIEMIRKRNESGIKKGRRVHEPERSIPVPE